MIIMIMIINIQIKIMTVSVAFGSRHSSESAALAPRSPSAPRRHPSPSEMLAARPAGALARAAYYYHHHYYRCHCHYY